MTSERLLPRGTAYMNRSGTSRLATPLKHAVAARPRSFAVRSLTDVDSVPERLESDFIERFA